MIRYLKAGDKSIAMSRLALAVVTGLLQSMVEATPQRVGQTFLRRLYDQLHELEEDPIKRRTGMELYYTRVGLTEEDWLDLEWWATALELNIEVQAYSSQQGTIGISYGDGSGSGTGGTIQVYGRDGECPTMEAWMGTWTPQVHSFSSNWRELRTLVHTLERELGGTGWLHHSTLFYFTDNLVTYYIISGGSSSSPELQKLIRHLKYLELKLGIRLEVIHIPGKHMIEQGTDGLSRGLQLSGTRLKRAPQDETQRVFEAVQPTPRVLAWAHEQLAPHCRHPTSIVMNSISSWTFQDITRQSSLWFPAPEWAHQLLDAVVNVWVERPWDTEAFFIIPRVFQRDWGRVSKHIIELGLHPAADIPDYGALTDIPCLILHLPCYVRSLPPPRWMEPPTQSQREEWHREQAEHLRGLS